MPAYKNSPRGGHLAFLTLIAYQAAGGGDATVPATAVATTIGVPSPTITTTATVTPSTVGTVVSVPSPTILTGTVVSPATVGTTVSVPAPTITASATVTPSTVSTVVSVPTPSIPQDTTVTATLLSEPFTGSDGSGWDSTRWPTQRYISSGTDTATFTIQSNAGQIINVGGAADEVQAYAFGATDYTDFELTFRVTVTTNGNHFIFAGGRFDTNITSGNPAGYAVYFDNNVWELVKLSSGGLGYTNISGTSTLLGADPTDKMVRMRFEGTSIKAKVWNFGSAEPGAWTQTATDSDHTSGRIMLGALQYDTASAAVYDSVLVEDITQAPFTVQTTVSIPTPTVLTGGTPTPTTVPTVISVPAPTITTTATVTPGVVGTVVAVPAPTITATATVTPATVATNIAIPAPTITTTAVVTPTVVGTVIGIPAPTIASAGFPTPAVVPTVIAIPTPTITASATVTPSPVSTVVSIPTPSIVTGGSPAPDTVNTIVGIPAPTITASATVTPGVVQTVVAVPAPGFSLQFIAGPVSVTLTVQGSSSSLTLGPTVVGTVVGIPTPLILIPGTPTPATVATTVGIPTPVIDIPQVSPSTVATVVSIPSPSFFQLPVLPSFTIVTRVFIPTPAISIVEVAPIGGCPGAPRPLRFNGTVTSSHFFTNTATLFFYGTQESGHDNCDVPDRPLIH